MGFSPLSKDWKSKLSFSKAVVSGEINGFHIAITMTPDDFDATTEHGIIEGLDGTEIGVFQLVVDQMLRQGITPLYRNKGSVADSVGSETTREPGKWECPEHGSQAVYENKFPGQKGLMCSKWISANEPKPNWCTAEKPSTVKNRDGVFETRWYCKYREYGGR